MKTISIMSQKGGTGKSTIAISLVYGLTDRGKKVLAVDLDAQANLSDTLNADRKQTIAELLTGATDITKVITPTETADVIPADGRLTKLRMNGYKNERMLKNQLERVSGKYDFCIIDNAPMVDGITTVSLTSSDYALIVTELTLFGYKSSAELEGTIDTIKQNYNKKLQLLGYVYNRMNPQAIIHKQYLEAFQKHTQNAGIPVSQPVRQSIKIAESQALKENIFKYAKRAAVTADLQTLVDAVLKETE